MAGDSQNGWNEYSRLVLKELETLAEGIEGLRTEIQDVKQEIALQKIKEDKVSELRAWKERIDEVASPSQIKGLVDEVESLKSRGLIAGGSLENAIVLDNDGIINKSALRHDDEFVRHKVLDFIGDIYLLGNRVRGSFEIYKGGHRLTHELSKLIMADKSNWQYVDDNHDLEKLDYSTLKFKKELSA